MRFLFTAFLISIVISSLYSQVPNLQVTDTSGNNHNLPNYLQNNKNYCLFIWSAQDPPSTAALTDYNSYYSSWMANNNLEFLMINIDGPAMQTNIKNYVKQQGWTYTLLFSDTAAVVQAFGINQIPHIYLVTKGGQIVFNVAGWMQGNLLDQEINSQFPVGINDIQTLNLLKTWTSPGSFIIETQNYLKNLKAWLYQLDGKLIREQSYSDVMGRIEMSTVGILPGTIVIVKVEWGNRTSFSELVLIK